MLVLSFSSCCSLPALPKIVAPVAIRLRRDFKTVLTLVGAYSPLHQANRRKDSDGRLAAEIAGYAAVRELVADLVAEGAEVAIAVKNRG